MCQEFNGSAHGTEEYDISDGTIFCARPSQSIISYIPDKSIIGSDIFFPPVTGLFTAHVTYGIQ